MLVSSGYGASRSQWDYFSLPAQAREFHLALQKASVNAQLVFIPRESHISEMLNVTSDKDPTVTAVLQFMESLEL